MWSVEYVTRFFARIVLSLAIEYANLAQVLSAVSPTE
jgi:hypothetical protein